MKTMKKLKQLILQSILFETFPIPDGGVNLMPTPSTMQKPYLMMFFKVFFRPSSKFMWWSNNVVGSCSLFMHSPSHKKRSTLVPGEWRLRLSHCRLNSEVWSSCPEMGKLLSVFSPLFFMRHQKHVYQAFMEGLVLLPVCLFFFCNALWHWSCLW